MRHLLAPALGTLVLTAPLAGCAGADRLVTALADASAPTLVAPVLDGTEARSWTLEGDGDLTLRYGKRFSPTLTLREASAGDLCAGRQPDWDRCTVIDDDAVRLGFEEQDALVVRREGTELVLGNITFEVPDEEYGSTEEMLAAIQARRDAYVAALREAPALSAAEFVDAVPKGSVERD